jgi:glucose/arabinose dehydrogenase
VLAVVGCASGSTDPATDVTDRAATLHAHGSAGGDPTTYWFQYGTSTSYGTETTHRDAGSSTSQQNVSERITGMSPDTTYHFRVCASNKAGSGCGADKTFRTGSPGMLPGFQETVAFSGLTNPTSVRFSPDGRVFVAERSGLIQVFDGLDDPTPTVFADLRTKVHAFWDRGLLGLALDPNFPAKPFVYVAYTYDAAIGGTAPRWGQPGATSDGCPDPPGANTDGCVVSGRVSRLQAKGNVMTGDEQVLIEDWCQQYPSHSVGDLQFAPDGSLYMTGGEGASFGWIDFGASGNPCNDPPLEGGALRSQDLRTTGDPAGLSGTLIRIDPDTGLALPTNPLASRTDPDAQRIVAYGLRNPFRFAFRPGTSDAWIGDVGWGDWEEIDRVPDPLDSTIENFGWPCYEGAARQAGYDSQDLALCESLYSTGANGPYYAYNHTAKVNPEESCPTGSSSISGMAFTPPNSTLPADYDGALFFADYSRRCIWVMKRGTGTLPSPSNISTFRDLALGPVYLQFGPGNDLYYADFDGGRIMRIHYTAGNQAPRAVATASATTGNTPLTVSFDGTGSSDPDAGDSLSFAWDLDGDGAYDDATTPRAAWTYTSAGTYRVGLKVTDSHGASATDTIAVTAGNTPPTATITAPTTGFTWKVGDPINFTGSATDPQNGTLPPSALSWSVVLHHCPSNCHTHSLQTFSGVDHGTFPAPDHEYPSYLELSLTATDSGGLTDTRTIRLDPKTVALTFASNPSGLSLTLNAASTATPFTRTVILGSSNSISAPTPQTLGGLTYNFGSWSDGGARAHTVTATSSATYTATYQRAP